MATEVKNLAKTCGLKRMASSSDYEGAIDMADADTAEIILFESLRVAVLNATPDQRDRVTAAARQSGVILEEERWNYSQTRESLNSDLLSFDADMVESRSSIEYLRGLRDGLSRALDAMEGQPALPSPPSLGFPAAADFSDSDTSTWGLQATGVVGSTLSGAGVKIAVLDSGCSTAHPDIDTARVTSRTFIPDSVQNRLGQIISLTDKDAEIDVSGHGTHCIGTACGPRNPGGNRPRYGIAHGSEIFNGKVLSVLPGTTRAAGADAWILGGMEWAMDQGCSIISMSLGSPVESGDVFSKCYENTASDAFGKGILIVAAAGNDSARQFGIVRPVSSPANCPSILAVGAVARQTNAAGVHRLARFTNRKLRKEDDGGEVNLCGPGVDVSSCYPSPLMRALDGTSQATPHVAGILALVQEETGEQGLDLYLNVRGRAIAQGVRNSVDYGFGLVHV